MQRFVFCFFSALASITLAGCSANIGKFYDRDGPPSDAEDVQADALGNAVPRIEKPVAAANRPYTVMGKRYYPMTGDKAFSQTGIASWYGKQFHGHKTAIGDIYSMYEMTAAHPTMELPSYARVTNLKNGKSVIVRVNDRGPFLGGRVIDMSFAAAVKLGYHSVGTAHVRVERITRKEIAAGFVDTKKETLVATAKEELQIDPIETLAQLPPEKGIGNEDTPLNMEELTKSDTESVALPTKTAFWGAQIGAFTQLNNAKEFAAHAEMMFSEHRASLPVRIEKDGTIFRVIVGKLSSRSLAVEKNAFISSTLGINSFVIQK